MITSLFSQGNSPFYEKTFIRKITKEYVNYEKKYKPKIKKIVLDSLRGETLNKDSLNIIIVPTINYKKKTSWMFFRPDTTKFFYYLNPKKLYFGEAFVFYKNIYIGYVIVTKSFKKPKLIYVYDTTSSYCKCLLLEKEKCVKYQVNNRFKLFFYIDGNNKYYNEINEKNYNNINKLNITPKYDIWYNKIKYISGY